MPAANAAQDAASLPQRLHPATLLLALGKIGPRAVNGAPALLALGIFNSWQTAVLIAAALLLVSLLFDWIGWLRFTYSLGAEDIRIDSGVLSRSHVVIPYGRIQDVGIEQGPVARLLGIARVKLETGGQGNIVKDDGLLDAIGLDEANALREAIRAHRAQARAAGRDAAPGTMEVPAEGEPAAAERPIYIMTIRRVLTAGLFNFSLTLFAALFALLQTFDDVLPFDMFDPDNWIDVIGRDSDVFAYIDAHRWLVAILGLAFVALIGIVSGVVATLLRDYGFALTRSETGLRRVRGLLTRTDVSLPIRRVQAGIVVAGIIRRQFGWRVVKVQSLGNDEAAGEGGAQSDHILAPLANRLETAAIFAELGLAEPDDAAPWAAVHALYAWTLLVPLLLGLVGLALAGWLISPWMLLLVPAWIGLIGVQIWARARHSWLFDGAMLHIRHGGLRNRLAIIPARHVQSADVETGPLARRFGLATLKLGIAGGGIVSPHAIHAIDATLARLLRHRLLAQR